MPLITTITNAPLTVHAGIPLHVNRYRRGSYETHYHRFLEIVIANEARGANVVAGKRTEFRRGDVYRMGMFHPHRIEAQPGERCDYFNVTFLPEALSGSGAGVNEMLHPFYSTSISKPITLDAATYKRVIASCEAIIAEIEHPDRQTAAIVLGEFRVLLGLVTRAAGPGPDNADPRVQQVLRIISERFAEPLETRELAQEVGASASRLAQLMQEYAGSTIKSALLRRRLTEAKRLLATTSTPITHVLHEAGFNDVSYFNRAFKRDTGLTPREFRNRALAEEGQSR